MASLLQQIAAWLFVIGVAGLAGTLGFAWSRWMAQPPDDKGGPDAFA